MNSDKKSVSRRNEGKGSSKKSYKRPALTVHGPFREITQTSHGNHPDSLNQGANPS